MEIYPSILAYSKAEFVAKLERVRPLGLQVHVDVMDGSFVAGKTWAEASEMQELVDEIPFNVHLMVADPEHQAPVWAVSGANRVYFHFEATHRHQLITRAVKQKHKMGLVINPATSTSEIGHLLDEVSSVLVMSVVPGKSGQQFIKSSLDKIHDIKRMRPNLNVVVDGGIKPHNIAAVALAGADAVVVGSALTDNEEPSKALAELHYKLKGVVV